MPLLTVIVFAALVPTAALAIALSVTSLRPKRGLVVNLVIALLAPLFILLVFIGSGYRHWNWSPFAYGSLLPHFVAVLASFTLLARALVRVGGSKTAKALVGVLAAAAWFGLWMGGMFVTTCGMGDCI
jgi:hypothetical protein